MKATPSVRYIVYLFIVSSRYRGYRYMKFDPRLISTATKVARKWQLIKDKREFENPNQFDDIYILVRLLLASTGFLSNQENKSYVK